MCELKEFKFQLIITFIIVNLLIFYDLQHEYL